MSYRTTLTGLGSILAALGHALTLLFDGLPATNPDWSVVIAACTAGLGLIFARDNKVSSAQVAAAAAK